MNEYNDMGIFQSLWAETVDATPYHHLSEEAVERRRAGNALNYHAEVSSRPIARAMIDELLTRTRRDSIRSVLEIGAGTGLYTMPLAGAVERVTVIDPSPGMLTVLRGNMELEHVTNVEIHELSWPDGFSGQTHNLVFAANCLLAFHDFEGALSRMIQSADKALCLISPMTVRPRPHDPELRRHLARLDRGPDADCLSLLLGMLSARSIYPAVRVFSSPSWVYSDPDKLYDRWAEALNLKTEEEHAQLRSLLAVHAREDEEGWTVPGFSLHFLIWADLGEGNMSPAE